MLLLIRVGSGVLQYAAPVDSDMVQTAADVASRAKIFAALKQKFVGDSFGSKADRMAGHFRDSSR